MVTHVLVTCKLDYCNALYVGLPLKIHQKLQVVQKATVWMLLGNPKVHHVTPVLKELCWLPAVFQVLFKVLVIAYHALYGMGPG